MEKLKTAIILAGGKGMRLRPYTETVPKPMIKLDGQPILHWIIQWLMKYGIEKIVIGVAHQKEKIFDFVSNCQCWLNLKNINLFQNLVMRDQDYQVEKRLMN